MNVIVKLTRTMIFLFLLCGGLYLTKGFLVPITFGALLAMLFVPLCTWLEKKGVGKALSAILCVLAFVALASGIIALLSWQLSGLAHDADQITKQLGSIPERVQEFIHRTIGMSVEQQQKMMKQQDFSSKAGAKLSILANSAASLLATFFLVVVYIFLFIYYRRHLENFILKLVSEENRDRTKKIIMSSGKVAQQYISGLGMMIGVLWIMYGIGFSIIGVRHALFFAMLCGLLEMMPYVGNLIGTTLTAVMAYTQGGSSMALWIVGVYLVVQFTQTYILEPLIVGARVSINPLCTIIVIIIGEMIWGIPGMILAIPLLGIVKIICDNITWLQPIGFLIGEVKHREKKVKIQS
jgi:predicted PurR-regulated permease PerM